MAQRWDDPDAAVTVAIGVIGALMIFLLIVALQILYYHTQDQELAALVYSRKPEELSLLRAKQEELLHSYRWIDQAKDVAGIPIERAMELALNDIHTSATLAAASRSAR
ncbi:MAG: hypothetical protein NTW86_29540 [Candidatus Sumerlaeota bacterium]|nr:hypothetical protein [Candidatus Sumerlaeota bacterium]